MKKSLLIPIAETATLVALAFVLELISSEIPLFNKPQGGHVTLAFLPLLVIGYRRGLAFGIVGGLCYACLELLFGATIYHWGSVFLDYLFVGAAFGISGLFIKKRSSVPMFCLGIVLFGFAKFTFHFLSGIILFREFAGTTNELGIWLYSAVYNFDYVFISTLICLVVGVFVHRVVTTYNLKESK